MKNDKKLVKVDTGHGLGVKTCILGVPLNVKKKPEPLIAILMIFGI